MPFRRRTCCVLLLAALSLEAGACRRAAPERQLDVARDAALTIISGKKPFAARFSGEKDSRDRPFPREAGESSLSDGLEAAAAIERAAGRRSDVAAQSALGVARAAVGELHTAVRLLEACATREPGNAAVLNDLAAMYLLRAGVERRSDDVIRGLTFAGRASRLTPALLEPRFNRARALEALGLAAARIVVPGLARRDPASPWGRHARARSQANPPQQGAAWDDLRTSLEAGAVAPDSVDVGRLAQNVREYIDVELLGRWGRQWLAHQSEAAATLTRAAALAERLAAANGDRLSQRGIAAIAGASATARNALARGHVAWADGMALYERDAREQSRPFFVTAVRELRAGGSPAWAWPELQGALLDYHAGHYDQALHQLEVVRRYADAGDFASLAARARWMEGIVLTQQSRLAPALANLRAARTAFEALGETENVVAIAGTMANSLRIAGDAREAWEAVHLALSKLDAVRQPVRRYVLLHNAAMLAFRMGFDEAAADLSSSAVAYAKAGERPGPTLEALAWLAIADSGLGDTQQAGTSLLEAEQLLPRVTDPVLQVPLGADIAYARAAMVERASPLEAIVAADRALDVLVHRNPPIAFNVLPIKVRAALATGQANLARDTLQSGIDLFEERLQKLPSERLRISYFDTAWDLYTAAARLALDAGNQEDAFRYFERARSRVLLESLTGPAAVPALSTLAGIVPREVTLVSYASLDDELITWVLSARGPALYRQKISRAALDAEVESRAARLANGVDEPRSLERMLLDPWIERVAPGSTIAIAVDGSLHRLAFAGLRVNAQQFLIERNPLAVIPSVSTYVALARGRSGSAGAPANRTALLVDAGQVDDPNHRLPNLASVELEIREARRAYASSAVLAGHAATPEALTRLADGYDVVHFGGHAVANEEFPLASALVLPGDTRLTVEQLGQLRWNRVRLVVLAACSTARGPIWRGEGVVSLARPFLAGGVPTVMATLADVDDRVSARLFSIFHREIAGGASPAEALRRAQTTLLRTGTAAERAVSAWAPFVVIGVP